jgi:hypothetical protein
MARGRMTHVRLPLETVSLWPWLTTPCKGSAFSPPRANDLQLRDAHREVIVAVANGILISILTGTVFQSHVAANTSDPGYDAVSGASEATTVEIVWPAIVIASS